MYDIVRYIMYGIIRYIMYDIARYIMHDTVRYIIYNYSLSLRSMQVFMDLKNDIHRSL